MQVAAASACIEGRPKSEVTLF